MLPAVQAACKDMGWSHGILSRLMRSDNGSEAEDPIGRPPAMVASCGPQILPEQGQRQGVGDADDVELDSMSGACTLGDVEGYNRQARGDFGGDGIGDGGAACSMDNLVHLLCANVE